MPFYKWVGNQVLTKFQNTILGIKLSEFHSGYRMYSTKVLSRIPFEENDNDFHFDTQIIIQCRALNVDISEVPIKTFYGEEDCNVNGVKYAFNICIAVIEYRLHQLHIIRRSRYLVRHDFVYTRKYSSFSSHEKILAMIEGPGKCLDLGSSNGLLMSALERKGIDTICVDQVDSDKVSVPKDKYIQADLESPDNIEFKREFDYIILADVIEHVRNAPFLLEHIQRFLKKDGTIIVSVPNIVVWVYRLSFLIGRFNYGPRGTLDETHVRFYTLSTIIQTIERAGYIVCDVEPTNLPFEVLFESVGKSKTIKLIDWMYSLAAKNWQRMFAYQFVVSAQISHYAIELGEGKIIGNPDKALEENQSQVPGVTGI